MNDKIAKVLLPLPFDKAFDYLIPSDFTIEVGEYVLVPFGKKSYWGIVWDIQNESKFRDKLKPIKKTIKEEDKGFPNFPEGLRKLVNWQAKYTLQNLGDVLGLCFHNEFLDKINVKERTSKAISTSSGNTQTLLESKERTLSEEQQQIYQEISKERENNKFTTHLIDGITGSGKTEVYFKLAEEVINEGKQVLIMLPEILLSNQIIERFTKKFGFAPEIWHSGITKAKRRHSFKKIAKGQARAVIGARSALHLPYLNLGLIIIDEEHDQSFKQEEQVIYNARDMAIARANMEDIPIILASATPSVESYHNANEGKYFYHKLHTRYTDIELPENRVIDMRDEKLSSQDFISKTLQEEVQKTIEQGKQALLFLNRRGYAPLTLCDKCGYRFSSPDTSSWMVMHYDRNNIPYLECHHTGFRMRLPDKCPKCEAEQSFRACGPGTQRIFQEAERLFPDANILEISSDSSKNDSGNTAIENIKTNNVDIIIGTQIIAKGHNFPDLKLVGIIDGDLGLNFEDLRAGEKSFQVMHQVSGRAGRAKEQGLVLIQSYNPDNKIIQLLKNNDKKGFLEYEVEERRKADLPPFSRLIAIMVSTNSENRSETEARNLANHIITERDKASIRIDVFGPAKAIFYELRGNYRYRILLRSAKNYESLDFIKTCLSQFKTQDRNTKIKVDVDPYSFA